MKHFARLCIALFSLLLVNAVDAFETKLSFGPPPSMAKAILDKVERTEAPIGHAHPDSMDGLAAGEADRLAAMHYVIHCNVKAAEQLFVHSLMHDQNNEATILALMGVKRYLNTESRRRTREALESERYALKLESMLSEGGFTPLLYILQLNQTKFMFEEALECNDENEIAKKGYTRTWLKQHGSWTLADRLGYYTYKGRLW